MQRALRSIFNMISEGAVDRAQTFLGTAIPILIIVVCLTVIIWIIIRCIIKDYPKVPAILLSTSIGCLLMIPIISNVNKLLDAGIIAARIDEMDQVNREIMIKRQEILIDELNIALEENRIAMNERNIEIRELSENITLLESANLNVRSFNNIFEVALLQLDLNQTTVRKDRLNRIRRGFIRANYYFDEVLVVISHDIEANFGIDLNKIMVSSVNQNSVVISGITPKYIGTSRNLPELSIAETRRVNQRYNAAGELETVSSVISNDIAGITLANNRAHSYANQFQDRLSQGIELGFMDDAVIQLAEHFLIYIFSPHFENIEFSSREMPGAIPFLEYFETETNSLNDQRQRLRLENVNLTQINAVLEEDIRKLAQELDTMIQEHESYNSFCTNEDSEQA